MSKIPYDATAPMGLRISLAIGKIAEGLADVDRAANVALGTADTGGGPVWARVVSSGDFGVSTDADAQALFTSLDGIRLAFGAAQQPGGAAIAALRSLDKGA